MAMKKRLTVLWMIVVASVVHTAEGDWERLPDDSQGMVTEFRGAGGLVIPAYVRKPKGEGPFPVVVMLHGGGYRKGASAGMGRSTKAPVAAFIEAGWAVYCTDYRPNNKIALEPIETDDAVEAIKTVRKLPYIDSRRVALWGASHGANVSSRVIARAELSGTILCAPAAMDLIEVKKADGRGEPVVQILRKLIGDMEKKYGAKAEEIEKDPAKYGYTSAMTETAQARCPLLILNARDDDNSPISIMELYVKKLRAAGKQVETYFPEKGRHGFYVGRTSDPEYKEGTRRSVAFLRKCFGDKTAPADQAAAPQKPVKYDYGEMNWVDPDRTEAPGTKYKTFVSKTVKGEVSYLVYLPPDYDEQPTRRYPVLYYLHASGGTPRRDAMGFAPRFDQAIRAGRIPPLIIIFPNGLRGGTMYSDSKDGHYPVESVIVNDLVPHVDATYRTVAAREGRALDGFSMGGFGAAHFGFKYPEIFAVVSIMAPPLLGPDLKATTPARAWSRLFPTMGNDLDYYRTNDPFALIPKNAEALRDRSIIRIVTHIESENWLAPRCEQLHQLLMKHQIAHQFLYLSNVKSHNREQCLDSMGDSGLVFYASAFAYLQKRSGSKPAAQPEKVKQQATSKLIALTDLGTNEYKGFRGGLYPDGKNTRPARHEAAGIELARQVRPLDPDGKPSSDGKIVLLGIGFSNTVQAFNGFMQVAKEDKDLNPKLVLVNGAKGGRSALMIQNPDDGKMGTDYWQDVDKRLKAAGVTRQQVQVVWIKETNPNPPDPGFPKFTQDLQAQIGNIVRLIQKRFPNVKLAYFSSRTYGGWAHNPKGGMPGNSEPFSYETGFAVKWLIEQQLNGESALNFDAKKGPVQAPWLSWSAYLWTNGSIKRGDSVSFGLEDFMATDHMHESLAGQRKVGNLLLRFFKTDSTTRSWFVK